MDTKLSDFFDCHRPELLAVSASVDNPHLRRNNKMPDSGFYYATILETSIILGAILDDFSPYTRFKACFGD